MSYKAFALKYRPQDFSEVIGQDHVVVSLKKAIEKDHIHHAYLFSGPRGVGKTSLARILAKALNCQDSDKPTSSPCGKCTSCREIQQGRSLDVIEIDGASNRGIDEIRTLRENVKYSPSYSRFKVYIIDEVHQITHDAFNALLKTLEEPPPHVKFIFATTNPNKIPATILSRCQKFSFGLVSEEKIIGKLKHIVRLEQLKADDQILSFIAKASSGSIRDAESIFDQTAPLIMEGTNLKDILDILGQAPEYKLSSFIDFLLAKDAVSALGIINETVEEGQDLNNFLVSVIEYLRNIMLAKLSENLLTQVVDLPGDLCKKVMDFSKRTNLAFLLKAIDSFIEANKTSRFLPSLRIPLEVAVVKITYTEDLPQEDKVKKSTNTQEPPQKPKEPKKEFGFQHKTATLNLENVSNFVDSLKSGFRHRPKQAPKDTSSESPDKEFGIKDVNDIWEEVISDMTTKKMSVATYLGESKVLRVEGRIIIIGFPKNLSFHKESLEKRETKQFVEDMLMAKLNKKLGIKYILTDEVKVIERKDPPRETINKIMDAFDGEVVS